MLPKPQWSAATGGLAGESSIIAPTKWRTRCMDSVSKRATRSLFSCRIRSLISSCFGGKCPSQLRLHSKCGARLAQGKEGGHIPLPNKRGCFYRWLGRSDSAWRPRGRLPWDWAAESGNRAGVKTASWHRVACFR